MGLFGKKKDGSHSCCCSESCTGEDMARAESAKAAPGIKVLGAGCPKCRATEASAKEALAELGMTDEVEHVTDFASIAAYGVMSTPALVVDGKVVSCGKALNKDDAHDLIARARGVE